METTKRFGEAYHKHAKGEKPKGVCDVCGEVLEIDPESGEMFCPVCDNPEP